MENQAVPDSIVIEQPDGSMVLGVDEEKAQQQQGRTARAEVLREISEIGNEQRAAAEAAREANEYRKNAFGTSQKVFLLLLVYDFGYFMFILCWDILRRPTHHRTQTNHRVAADKAHRTAAYWWLNTSGLTIGDILLATTVDFLGLAGSFSPKTSLLSLFIILKALSIALLTYEAGLSLFFCANLALLGTGILLRYHLLQLQTLEDRARASRTFQPTSRTPRFFLVTLDFWRLLLGRSQTLQTLPSSLPPSHPPNSTQYPAPQHPLPPQQTPQQQLLQQQQTRVIVNPVFVPQLLSRSLPPVGHRLPPSAAVAPHPSALPTSLSPGSRQHHQYQQQHLGDGDAEQELQQQQAESNQQHPMQQQQAESNQQHPVQQQQAESNQQHPVQQQPFQGRGDSSQQRLLLHQPQAPTSQQPSTMPCGCCQCAQPSGPLGNAHTVTVQQGCGCCQAQNAQQREQDREGQLDQQAPQRERDLESACKH